jgi:single-stranded DNA-binding protein
VGPRQTSVVTFVIAVSQGRREQRKPPIWMDVEAWGGLADSAAANLRKGDKVRPLQQPR